jgi:hypothetical protein
MTCGQPARKVCLLKAASVVSLKSLGSLVRDNVVCKLLLWDCGTGTVTG